MGQTTHSGCRRVERPRGTGVQGWRGLGVRSGLMVSESRLLRVKISRVRGCQQGDEMGIRACFGAPPLAPPAPSSRSPSSSSPYPPPSDRRGGIGRGQARAAGGEREGGGCTGNGGTCSLEICVICLGSSRSGRSKKTLRGALLKTVWPRGAKSGLRLRALRASAFAPPLAWPPWARACGTSCAVARPRP
jgi:hypothetical protein